MTDEELCYAYARGYAKGRSEALEAQPTKPPVTDALLSMRVMAIRLGLYELLGDLPGGKIKPPRTYEGQVVDERKWEKLNELLGAGEG